MEITLSCQKRQDRSVTFILKKHHPLVVVYNAMVGDGRWIFTENDVTRLRRFLVKGRLVTAFTLQLKDSSVTGFEVHLFAHKTDADALIVEFRRGAVVACVEIGAGDVARLAEFFDSCSAADRHPRPEPVFGL